MNLRTYRARTMGDCLAEVKKDLGKDAVILHTRSYKVGGVLGLGAKPMVEVTASSGGAAAGPPRKSANIAALRAYSPQPAAAAPFRPLVDRAARNAAVRNESSVNTAIAELPPEPAPPRAVERMPVMRTGPAEPPPVATIAEAKPQAGLTEEIASLKRMLGQVLQCSRQTALRVSREPGSGFAPSTVPDAVFQHYLRLLESDIAHELADEVMARIQADIAPPRCEDEATVRAAVVRALAALIPADIESPRPSDNRPLTLALIGPTGVGKTTTVAKLAATFKLRQNKRVGLITSDTYRIAAVDQLRTYAEIIGLPLKVAMTPADMSACCQSLADCDIILLDTAGRSQRDAGRLDELRQFIDAARPHQTHLVLSSVASEAVLLEAAARFGPVHPDRLIFTKLDEAVKLGVLFTVAHRVGLPLSFITTGQEVPDHIEPGRPERLAELLVESPDRSRAGGVALSGAMLR